MPSADSWPWSTSATNASSLRAVSCTAAVSALSTDHPAPPLAAQLGAGAAPRASTALRECRIQESVPLWQILYTRSAVLSAAWERSASAGQAIERSVGLDNG